MKGNRLSARGSKSALSLYVAGVSACSKILELWREAIETSPKRNDFGDENTLNECLRSSAFFARRNLGDRGAFNINGSGNERRATPDAPGKRLSEVSIIGRLEHKLSHMFMTSR
jgi:hypothetical protein